MSRRIFITLLALGAVARAAGLTSPGTPDVTTFRTWTYAAATLGPSHLYGTGNHWGPDDFVVQYQNNGAVVDYPPLAVYVLAITGWAYRAVFPSFPDTSFLTATLKLPGLLASIALTALLWRVARQRYGDAAGRLVAVAYWANPAVILQGAFLGFLDPLFALPAVAALVAATTGAAVASGALLAVACMTKPQGVFVAPAIAFALMRFGARAGWRQLLTAAVSGSVALAIIIWPIVRADALLNMLFALRGQISEGMLSGNAANVWWVVGYAVTEGTRASTLRMTDLLFAGRRVAGHLIGTVTMMAATTSVLGAIILRLMWRARRSANVSVATALAALTVHLYFVLAVQVHENHLFLALPLLAMLIPVSAQYRRLFVLVSGISFFNLNLFYGFGYGESPVLRDSLKAFDVTVLLALVNIGALLWHLWLFVSRTCREGSSLPC